MTKKIYKIKGMDCTSCATMIELDLEDAGIKCSCSFPNETLEVDISGDADEKKIIETVEKSGYKIVL